MGRNIVAEIRARPHDAPMPTERLLDDAAERIEDLEMLVRATILFMEEGHTDENDGYATLVLAALRGALKEGE